MATKTIIHITDDLDGSDDNVDTIKFGLHGAAYEVDLSKANQSKLERALEPFMHVARRAGASPRKASGVKSSSTHDAKQVRVWAAENGITLPARGRIPGTVLAQYGAAQH